MTLQKHLIKKQLFDIHLHHQEHRQEVEQAVRQLWEEQLQHIVAQTFDEIADAGTVIRIPRLELDLGSTSLKTLATTLPTKLEEALREALPEILEKGSASSSNNRTPDKQDLVASTLELFAHLLSYGRLPWWHQRITFTNLDELGLQLATEQPSVFRKRLVQLLKQPQIRKRFFFQTTTHSRQQLLHQLFPVWSQRITEAFAQVSRILQKDAPIPAHQSLHKAIRKTFSTLETYAQDLVWESLLSDLEATKAPTESFTDQLLTQWAALTDSTPSSLLLWLKQVIQDTPHASAQTITEQPIIKALLATDPRPQQMQEPDTDQQPSTVQAPDIATSAPEDATPVSPPNLAQQLLKLKDQTTHSSTTSNEVSITEPLYLNEAGLVLTWSFLQRYFNVIELLNGTAFKDEQAAIRAVHLLHFLATGETTAPEHELVIPKLLCGLDLQTPVPVELNLLPSELEAGNDLLKALLNHWPPMKGTSVEGLQSAFLQREGRLTESDQAWELQVESKTYDIILDKAPFSYSVVKLPWMSKILYVHWR